MEIFVPAIQRTWQWIKASPVAMTFMLSIALSLASLSYRASMNPDGMVHIMTGRIFIEEGFLPALEFFDWPFFSILIGIVGYILPISYEAAGHLLNILMLSTTCVLLVKIIQRYVPNSIWIACLVVLALPGLNENRHEVMREDGAWMFLILAIWLAIREPKKVTLLNAIGPALSLFAAFLFRAEMIAFYPALILWQWYALQENRSLPNTAKLFALPALTFGIFLVSFLSFNLDENLARARFFIGMLDINTILIEFYEKSKIIDSQIVNPGWLKSEGPAILAWGMIGYAFNSYLEVCYALCIPLVIGTYWIIKNNKSLSPFGLLFIVYAAVLLTFVFRQYFLTDRYTAPLGILSLPLIAYGVSQLYLMRSKVAAYLVTALLIINVLDNIITTGDQDTHIVQAGHWLQENNIPESETYIDFARIAYHADWVRYNFKFDEPNQERRDLAYNDPKIRYMTLWRHNSDEELKWQEGKNLILVAEFVNSKGRKVLILKKPE